MLTAYLGTAKSDLGADLTMDIITAVVLGGTLSTGGKGSIVGTALAVSRALLREGSFRMRERKAQARTIRLRLKLEPRFFRSNLAGETGVQPRWR